MLRRLVLACLFATSAHAAEVSPQRFARLGDLALAGGGTIRDCALGYRTVGTLNAQRSNAVLVPTWHTGTSEDVLGLLSASGWFDPGPWYVIVVDAIGNGVSCSPSNSRAQPGPAFPAFTIRDMVTAEYRLVTEKLGLTHLHAVLGFSMGGLQTFEWIATHPDFMDVAVPIAGSPRLTSADLLLWRTGAMAVSADPAYAGGRYARKPALTLFWSLLTLHQTTPQYRVAHTSRAEFEAWFRSLAAAGEGPDANDLLWQIRAMQAQDIDPATLARSRARVHVIHNLQDAMINPAPALDYARQAHWPVTELKGNCGHLAAVACEVDAVRAAVEQALKSIADEKKPARRPAFLNQS